MRDRTSLETVETAQRTCGVPGQTLRVKHSRVVQKSQREELQSRRTSL